MKLYEYAEKYEALKQMAEDESIPPEALADTLESIDDEFETKVDSIACIIKDELATAEAIKKEIDALTARMKRHEATAEQLKAYTMQQMQAVGKSKIETAHNVVSVAKKAPTLEIENADDFIAWATLEHEEFIRQKAPEINKVAVRDALKAGEELPGAKLVAGYRLAVR